MKRYYISTLAAFALTSSLYAGSPNDYVGAVWAIGTNYCPTYSLPADGRLLSISNYEPLYALIGTTYGGDGRINFALPDLSGRTPVSSGQSPGLSGVVLGQKRGQTAVTLTAANLPAHTHAATFTPSGTNPITVNIPVSANTSGNLSSPDSTHNTLAGTPNGPTSASMWTSTMTSPINIAGVTASAGTGAASVTVNPTGSSQAINTVPPALGVKYCVTVTGLYPPQP